jgi:hypothetical protein
MMDDGLPRMWDCFPAIFVFWFSLCCMKTDS